MDLSIYHKTNLKNSKKEIRPYSSGARIRISRQAKNSMGLPSAFHGNRLDRLSKNKFSIWQLQHKLIYDIKRME